MKNYRDEIQKYSTTIIEMEIGEIAMKEFNNYVAYRDSKGQTLSLSEMEEIGFRSMICGDHLLRPTF